MEKELQETAQLNEIFWAQRAHHAAIQEGDQDTGFFHARVKQQRKRYTIRTLHDHHRVIQSGQTTVQNIVISHFDDIFHSMSPCFDDISFEELQGKVSMEDGLWLTRPYTWQEVESALNQMAPTEAPGPEGFLSLIHI